MQAIDIPQDPSLEAMPEARRVFGRALRQLNDEGIAEIPVIADVPGVLIARWLYRHWLEGSTDWQPLVHLDPLSEPGPVELRELATIAAGGWLYLASGWKRIDHRLLAEACSARGARLLRQGEAAALRLRPEARARLMELDRYHLVAVDPSLTELRRSLLSHCRSCSAIHLRGPSGTGKRTLARWAHARLDDRAMMEVRRGGESHPGPGRWSMFEEVGELEDDQLHLLRERLRAMASSSPTRAPRRTKRISRPGDPAFAQILGSSPALARVLARAARYAPRAISVLILGESGVGKELLARAVHDASGRSGPYRVVDLSTLNEQLIESELFGHKRGAYTGAESDRLGAFRQAEGGTLFLDEIGNLSPRIQAKLLRVLQEKTVQPVGADRVVPVDVRVVCATNANLDGMVSRGEFRADLVQRINAATLRLPPLRERPEDLVPLAARFIARARRIPAEDLPADWLSPEAERVLRAHDWPGNVRELENIARQATAEAEDGTILAMHLGPLAPDNQRRTPLITTSSEEPEHAAWDLERDLVQRMTAISFGLPALRDREPESIRSAVLGLLGGRPIRLEALDALERRPWWGNFHELELQLAAIRSSIDGAVDLPSLQEHLPSLIQEGHRPIRVILNPVLESGGAIRGLHESYFDGALVIGRVARTVELERQAAARDAGDADAERWRFVRATLGTVQADCLQLEQLTRLSRAHVLITRDEQGLHVHTVPGARLPVKVARLDRPEDAQLVRPGAGRAVGAAADLQIETTGSGRTYLRLFLFAGAVAAEDYARVAAERVATDSLAGKTRVDGRARKSRTPRWTSGMWTLEPFERVALNDIVLRYPGGDFKAHLESELRPRADETEYARLAGYILRNRPTLYCTRLYTHDSNDALRRELGEAISGLPDARRRLSRLPTAIRRALEQQARSSS